MKIALITICAYSLILALVYIYKDESSYSMGLEPIDIVVGGPMVWLTFGFCRLIANPIYTRYQNYRKKHPKAKKIHLYTEKQIAHIFKKVLKAHLESCQKYKEDYRQETFALEKNYYLHHYHCEDDEIFSLEDLRFKTAKYEWLNRKYQHIYNHQYETLAKIAAPYFELWAVNDYEKCEFNKYWIHNHKDEQLWRIKSVE